MAKTSKEIRTSIKTFSTNRNELRDLAHGILMDIMIHACPTGSHVDAGNSGDATLALAMLKEMPTSWAEQAMAWFTQFSPIRAIPSRDKAGLDLKYKDLSKIENKEERETERLKWWKLEEAMETPFYKAATERPANMYGLEAITDFGPKTAKVWQKKLDDGKIKPEAIAAVTAFIAQMNSFKVELPKAVVNDDAAAETMKAAG